MTKNNGFTLVELLVVIAIAGLLLTVVLSLLLSGFENFNLGTDRAEIQNDIRLVENIIHNELRNAMYVKIDDLGSLEEDEDTTLENHTIEFKNGAFYQDDKKVTGDIFDEIEFKVINKNIFELSIYLKNREKPYKIKMLINNFDFDIQEDKNETRNLSENILEYQKEE